MLYSLFKPILFHCDAETAHDFIMQIAKLSPSIGRISGTTPYERLSTLVGRVRCLSPMGLAAGLDKNAEALHFLEGQGFGFLETGTITLRPQLGNPKPRMFRYPKEETLRNAMGFPNQGLVNILPRLKSFDGKIPVGANIGKNKDTSASESIEELSILFETLHEHVNYFVVNVSSPNTPGLRALQEKSYLTELFQTLNQYREGKDLYLKIAPDLVPEKIIELTHLAHELKLTGLIATNTTIMPERGAGGISGKLLTPKSKEVREIILKERLPIELIAVGGISHFQDVLDLWYQGGKAFQVYSAYVFQGPSLIKNMYQEMISFLDRQKIKDLNAFFHLSLEERREFISRHNHRRPF